MLSISWELLTQIAKNSGGYIDVGTGMIYRNQPGSSVNRPGVINVPYINGFYILLKFLEIKCLLGVLKDKYDIGLMKKHETVRWFDYFYVDYSPDEKRFLDIVHTILDDGSGRLTESSEFFDNVSAQIMQQWCSDNGIETISIPYVYTEAVYALMHGLPDMSLW